MGAEKNFENKIKDYLEEQGCWYVKFFANRNTKKGIPDILACVNGYFLGIEVKAPDNKPSELQLYNIRKIKESGGFACVVYPSGWKDFKRFIDDLKKGYFKEAEKVIFK